MQDRLATHKKSSPPHPKNVEPRLEYTGNPEELYGEMCVLGLERVLRRIEAEETSRCRLVIEEGGPSCSGTTTTAVVSGYPSVPGSCPLEPTPPFNTRIAHAY